MEGSGESKPDDSTEVLDPVSVLREITKVVTLIKQNEQNQKLNEINEMKQLRLLVCDRNPVRSVTACQGLLSLVEDNILPPIHAISILVSAFSSIENYPGVTAALSVLLRWDINDRPKPYECPFSLYPVQHPLISLLKQNRDTWPDVFRLLQNFLFQSDKSMKEENLKLLRPLLLYILCDPEKKPHLPPESRQKTWALMLHFLDDIPVRQLIFECVPWFQVSDETRCVEAGMLLLDLCEAALRTNDGPLCLALAPLATASVRDLVIRGADPEPCLVTVIRLLCVSPSAASCVMLLLADTIAVCPATFLAPIIKSCKEIFNLKACSQVSVYAVVSTLLPWLAFPSVLTREALQLATNFVVDIRNAPSGVWSNFTSRLSANPWFQMLRHSFENVHEAAELCRVSESWRDEVEVKNWLMQVQTSPMLTSKFSHFFCSLLICGSCNHIKEDDDLMEWPALSVLVWLAHDQSSVSSRITLTFLYQLAQEKRPLQQVALLRAIAAMGKHEENMALVVGVLKSLSLGGVNSSTLALDLYLRLWKVQPRAYRFLHESLTEPFKGDNPDLIWESNIAKAATIKEICCTNPDAHGSELVPLLSQLLTQNISTEGSTPSVLAVQGIIYLCRAGILNVASTWKGLAPKLVHDKRPAVIISLCELLSVTALLSNATGKFQDFINDVITTLWGWAQHSRGDVASAALKALSEFHLDQLTLKTLPALFRKNLKLPSSFCKTPIDAARDPVDVLPYIPGDCWKQVLESLGLKEDRTTAVCNMLASWMSNEIKLFHRGMYNQAPSKPEPTSYQDLHDSSILRSMFSLAYQGKHDSAVAALALSILAKELPRPLPPVTWNFLQEKLKEGGDIRKHSLEILAKQCKTSASANSILLSVLNSFHLPQDIEDCKTLMNVLRYLGAGIPPNHLGTFINKCVQYAVEEMAIEAPHHNLLLTSLIGHIKVALSALDVHEANKATLGNIIETLSEQLDVSHPIYSAFLDCALVLPDKNVERIISPSLWWEKSSVKLVRGVNVSSAIAMAQDSDMPLAAFNDVLDLCIYDESPTVERVSEALLNVGRVCREHESNCSWILQMLGRIQALKANTETSEQHQREFLQSSCDLLMVSVISLAGHDILAGNPKIIPSSSQDRLLLFPQALWALLNKNAAWKKLSAQVIEWLHDMSTAPKVPSLLSQTFRLAITPFRYHQHFQKSNVWMRILSSQLH